jgi:hypothetical protein
MLRVSPLVAQSERTTAALEWASAHGVLNECQTRFANVIAFLEVLPLERALPILRERYCPDHGRPAYDPLLMFRTELARRILRIDSRDDFALSVLAPSTFLRLLLGYPPHGKGRTPCGETLRGFEHRICPSRRRGATLPRKRSKRFDEITARAAAFLGRAHDRPPRMRQVSPVDRLLRAVGFEPATAMGLIAQDGVLMADGSFLPSRTGQHGKKICSHGRTRCECPRRYTDPLARLGHDHHEGRSVYGYLANIAAVDTAIGDPVVVAITMHGARRYDGVATLPTLARTVELYPELADRFLTLDTASDSASHGRFTRRLGLRPIVPLREPGKGGFHIDNIAFTTEGVPLCAGGHPMRPHGTVGDRQRWICPGEVHTSGIARHDPCRRRGWRTISFRPQDDYRLISAVHRGSRTFRALYARRSAIERAVNKPAMADGNIEHGSRVQSRGRRFFDLFLEALIGYSRAFIRFAAREAEAPRIA